MLNYAIVQAIVAFILLFAPLVQANVIFEGYYKIYAADTHAGFTVQRNEFNPATKQFEITWYVRTTTIARNITESVKAIASKRLEPVSYTYASTADGESKTIDIEFKNGRMLGTVKTNKTAQKRNEAISGKTILSAFLSLYMLHSVVSKDGKASLAEEPVGIKANVLYPYTAVAEELASIQPGSAFVIGEQRYLGENAFLIENTYLNTKYTSFVNGLGEVLGTESKDQGIRTELVASAEQATKNIPYNEKHLKLLFGNIPKGQINNLARRTSQTTAESQPAPATGKSSNGP